MDGASSPTGNLPNRCQQAPLLASDLLTNVAAPAPSAAMSRVRASS